MFYKFGIGRKKHNMFGEEAKKVFLRDKRHLLLYVGLHIMSYLNDYEVWTHLEINFRLSVLKCLFIANNWCKILDFQEYGLSNKARTLTGKKGTKQAEDMKMVRVRISKSNRRVAECHIRPPKVPVFQALS